MTKSGIGACFLTPLKSTAERYSLKDSQDRYSRHSYYASANSDTCRIPDNPNSLAVRIRRGGRIRLLPAVPLFSQSRVDDAAIELREVQLLVQTHRR